MLADVGRWWRSIGQRRGVDRAEVYDLLVTATRELEAAWSALPAGVDESRVFQVRPDNDQLPEAALLATEGNVPFVGNGNDTVLVVIDIRLNLNRG